jgi:hypothetical protein
MNKCSTFFSATVKATNRLHVPFYADVQPQAFIDYSELKHRTSHNIARLGTDIQIIRDSGIINTKVLIAPLTRISTPRTLQLIRTASFPADCGIQGGDLFMDVSKNIYYLFLIATRIETQNEVAGIEGMISWCNHTAQHSRLINRPSGVGGTKNEFETVHSDLRVTIEFISTSMREREPGIFRDSTHRCYIQNKNGVKPLDRLHIYEEDFRVDDIDTVTYPGISYCILSRETRRK